MAAAKPPSSVTNTLTADLDCGQHAVKNASEVHAGNVYSAGGLFVGQQGIPGGIQLATESLGNGPGIVAGDNDPTVVEVYANTGSLYLRSNGEWWRKHGAGVLDWTRVF